MWRAALVLLTMWAPAAWADARLVDRSETRTGIEQTRAVFVLLIGQPRAPGLPVLSAVSSDVAMMHAFFGTLSPVHSYVHLPPGDVRTDLAGGDTSTAAPTWSAVETSVRAIADGVDAVGGEADVYIYYAGHGRTRRVESHTHTDLYLEPESGSERGADGILSTRLLQEGVLGPIGRTDARVHLVVDACQSAFLLEARGMRQTLRVVKAPPPVGPAMIEQFTERYARVGALLATQGSQVTYESARTGGLFSYAVRTAGIGAADIDGDRRVTYGELSQVMPRILSERAGAGAPTLLAPGDRDDIAFVDYRGRGAVSVTFDPDEATRYELKSTYFEPYAALYPSGDGPVKVFLPDGAAFVTSARVASDGPRVWSRFQAANQLFASLQRPLDERRTARFADSELPPLVLDEPLTPKSLVPMPDPEWVHMPRRYTTLALSGLSESPVYGRTLINAPSSSAWGGEVIGAFGEGLDQISWRLGYARRTAMWHYDDVTTTYAVGHRPRLVVGYQRVLADLSLLELSGGAFGGGGLLIEQRAKNTTNVSGADIKLIPVAEVGGELTARVLLPNTAWAIRADIRLSSQAIFDEFKQWVDLTASGSLGVEYEFPLD